MLSMSSTPPMLPTLPRSVTLPLLPQHQVAVAVHVGADAGDLAVVADGVGLAAGGGEIAGLSQRGDRAVAVQEGPRAGVGAPRADHLAEVVDRGRGADRPGQGHQGAHVEALSPVHTVALMTPC